MTEIDAALQDERLARVMLAIASEPGDTVTGRLVRTLGPSETVRLGTEATTSDKTPSADVEAWRSRVSSGLNEDQARRALEDTERIGAQLLLPGDEAFGGIG